MEICCVIIQYILISPKLVQTIFKSVNSIGIDNMFRQTIPYEDYWVSKVEFPLVYCG